MFLVLVGALVARIVVRNNEVKEFRAPFLAALDSSPVCTLLSSSAQGPCNGTCAVELDNSNSQEFDLHPAENVLFGFIYEQLVRRSHSDMAEIVGGAHVQFLDPTGCAHKFLTSLPGAYKRISSHPSTSAQYGIKEGRVLQTILIGTNPNHMTWFQLEGSAWDPHDLVKAINHSLDTIIYLITRRQMGPLGTSVHTDKNPLRINSASSAAQPVCPKLCKRSSTILFRS